MENNFRNKRTDCQSVTGFTQMNSYSVSCVFHLHNSKTYSKPTIVNSLKKSRLLECVELKKASLTSAWLVWLATSQVSPGICSWTLPKVSSSSLACSSGPLPESERVSSPFPSKSVSSSSTVRLLLLGCTIVHVAWGSGGFCSPFRTIAVSVVLSEPSSVVHTEFVEAILPFKPHLASLPALAELRLDSVCVREDGGWGWTCGCEDDILGSSGTDFSTSLLLLFSVLTVSFFLFD